MKKFFTLLAAIPMATTLSMPAFAAKKHKNTAATTQTQGKKHVKHAKKKGAKEGQKTGQ